MMMMVMLVGGLDESVNPAGAASVIQGVRREAYCQTKRSGEVSASAVQAR